jgi:putative RNA 2'-phosphotransferase
MNEKLVKISKFLSKVLRHQPEIIGLELDQNAWANTEELLKKANQNGISLDFELLKETVDKNSKKRFAFSPDFKKIRASQGHSFETELGYENQRPPDFLLHGTSQNVVESIKLNGIEKRSRQFVHLSSDPKTASEVGKRHGKPYIFTVSAAKMYDEGFRFFLSDNGVWLTEFVPPEYLSPM